MSYKNFLSKKYHGAFQFNVAKEGYPCNLQNVRGKRIYDLKLYGKSEQEGEPSPDSPIEIQSVGELVTDETSEYYGKYDVPVTVCGKNLISYPYFYKTKTINGVTFTDNGDGTITANGTATTNNAIWFIYLNRTNLINGINSGDTITLSSKSDKSWSSDNMSIVCNYFNASGEEKDGGLKLNSNLSSVTKTVPDDWKGMEIYILVPKGKTVNSITISPQLEFGSTATSYEPYSGIETVHIYLDEPLRKVGDYADYIDYKNQKVIRNVKHREFSSNDNWSVYPSVANHFQIRVGDNYNKSAVACIKAMSNYYPQHSTSQNSTTSVNYAVLSVDGGRIRFRDIRCTTLDEWKTFLDNLETPLTVDYILATPTEEAITFPELTLPDSNIAHIFTETSVPASNIKATTYR